MPGSAAADASPPQADTASQERNKLHPYFPHVPGSHGHHHVTFPEPWVYLTCHIIQARYVQGPDFFPLCLLQEVNGANRLHILLAVPGRIDVREDHLIRLPEGPGEPAKEEPGTGVLMGLEDAPQLPPLEVFPGRLQRSAYLRRVMPIIVYDRHPTHRVQHLEPAVSPPEFLQGLLHNLLRQAGPMSHGDSRQGILDVMAAGHPQGKISIMVLFVIYLKRIESPSPDGRRCPPGGGGRTNGKRLYIARHVLWDGLHDVHVPMGHHQQTIS
ncbi:MAG: hypothetical protein A3E19_05040 [Planctomycetes bacterium RIFCSPHIGHO2_12_FULL_52_36]|nr:MAG: hypothetical protein A3E19_05040 [Planctomycetes bacterium RIFCSPHIGHO2_12_FULL_52_36]